MVCDTRLVTGVGSFSREIKKEMCLNVKQTLFGARSEGGHEPTGLLRNGCTRHDAAKLARVE